MATGSLKLMFENGQSCNIYFAGSDAVSTPLHCSMVGAAGSTSPFEWSVNGKTRLFDITTVAGNTTGEFEFCANGQRTGVRIPTDQRWLNTQAGRKKYVPRVGFRPGVKYTCVMTEIQT